MDFKGIIALDIDGTVTAEAHAIDPKVVDYLHFLYQQHWKLIFITGRSFQWGFSTLRHLPFEFHLAVQNGAFLLDMPSRKILRRRLVNESMLPAMESICLEEGIDFAIYTGYENKDISYYRPSRIPSDMVYYLQCRREAHNEQWKAMDDYTQLPVKSYASFKCFADKERAYRISKKIEAQLGLHAPPIQDPFDRDYYVVQATHPEANKGQVLYDFKQMQSTKKVVIAAGDDANDLTMLQQADIKVVMETAPEFLLQIADVIAPRASEHGIIEGLQKAIRNGSI